MERRLEQVEYDRAWLKLRFGEDFDRIAKLAAFLDRMRRRVIRLMKRKPKAT